MLSNAPSPYLSPVYRLLKSEAEWDLTICYVSAWNSDVGWSRAQAHRFISESDVILSDQYPQITHWFGEQIAGAMSLFSKMIKQRPNLFLVYGYTRLPQLLLIICSLLFQLPFAIAGDANYYIDRSRGLRRRLKSWWLRLLARRAAGIAVVGTACQMFWEAYGASPERFFHVGFAVDNDYFREESLNQKKRAMSTRQQYGWSHSVVFLYVGRLIKRKNIDCLITAAQQIKDLPIAVLIAGEGEERESLQALARDSNIISFVGSLTQAELPFYYAMSDVLVLPASKEPWGLVINEAMACGLAVIAHQHCGAAVDLVTTENGIKLQDISVEELVLAIRCLAADVSRLRDCQIKSTGTIKDWSISRSVSQLKDLISSTLRPIPGSIDGVSEALNVKASSEEIK